MAYETKVRAKAKGLADNIPVFCSFDKIIKTKDLKPNPANPNTHPEEQLKKLAQNIQSLGWRNPITVSTRSGLIVKGHGRLMAAQLMDYKEVPVDFQAYSSDEEEMADLLADNRIQELSVTDKKALLQCFEGYDNGAMPFELSGYSDDEYRELAQAFDEYQSESGEDTKEDNEDNPEVEAGGKKDVKFTCCDYQKCCPHFGREGCSRIQDK